MVTVLLDRAEALYFAGVSTAPSAELRPIVENLNICPMPFLEEAYLWDVLKAESAWETYGTPPFAGAQDDQPAVMLDACDEVRGARAQCSMREIAEREEEAARRDRG